MGSTLGPLTILNLHICKHPSFRAFVGRYTGKYASFLLTKVPPSPLIVRKITGSREPRLADRSMGNQGSIVWQ
jgi:hypothetical protein